MLMTNQSEWDIFQDGYTQREFSMKSAFELSKILKEKAEREVNAWQQRHHTEDFKNETKNLKK